MTQLVLSYELKFGLSQPTKIYSSRARVPRIISNNTTKDNSNNSTTNKQNKKDNILIGIKIQINLVILKLSTKFQVPVLAIGILNIGKLIVVFGRS